MMVRGGSTDVTTYFQMRLLTGGDATGLTISDFDMQYVRTRETAAAKVDAVALAAANTAHTDNRGIEVDATDTPGLYRFDWPDAAFAAGTEVILTIKHTSCFTESLRVELLTIPTAAEINAEVVDALATDTYAEPGQGTPPATASIATKLGYLFKGWRNKKTVTETTFSLFNDDASTVDQKSTLSDDETTFTETEKTTGA